VRVCIRRMSGRALVAGPERQPGVHRRNSRTSKKIWLTPSLASCERDGRMDCDQVPRDPASGALLVRAAPPGSPVAGAGRPAARHCESDFFI
jgi:hypothetical protein